MTFRRFSEEKRDRILRMYLDGEKVEVIAMLCDCTKQYPGRLASWRGYPKRQAGKNPRKAALQ